MDWSVRGSVPYNSPEYLQSVLITDNGFREYDVRWLLGKEINPNGFVVLGRAYATFAREVLGQDTIVVGYDFRKYSQDLSRSLVLGLLWSGARVIDVGLVTTPLLYFAQHLLGCKAGAMVTASHNENGWTGLKLADGLSSTLGPDGIQEFKRFVYGGKFRAGNGSYETRADVFSEYMKDILSTGKLGSRMDVVVAAGNGTAGLYAPPVLTALGCNVIPLHCDLDWDFPNHNPNPEDLSFLNSIGDAVRTSGARIGIGIDGDGDRIGVVDETGKEVFSDKVGLLISRWLSSDADGRKVVIDVKSTGLFLSDPVLRKHHMEVIMAKTGHSYVKAAVAQHNALAGFERSGHWFFREPYGKGYDDAVLGAVQLVRMLDSTREPFSQMVGSLPKTWQSPTLGPYCSDVQKYDVVRRVTELYSCDREKHTRIAGCTIREIITVNGVRFVLEDGSWGLVRASSNKPSLVVVAESLTSEGQLYEIVDHIKARLAETGQVGEYDQQMPGRTHLS